MGYIFPRESTSLPWEMKLTRTKSRATASYIIKHDLLQIVYMSTAIFFFTKMEPEGADDTQEEGRSNTPTPSESQPLFPVYKVRQTPGGSHYICDSPFLGTRQQDRLVVSGNIYVYYIWL